MSNPATPKTSHPWEPDQGLHDALNALSTATLERLVAEVQSRAAYHRGAGDLC